MSWKKKSSNYNNMHGATIKIVTSKYLCKLHTTNCEIECPSTCDARVDISMAGFSDTGEPKHC